MTTVGYVGGDTIVALLEKYPAWESSTRVLVRDAERGALITAVYQKIRLVYGGLDDAAVLEEEAAKADIILNFADSDHLPSANALVRGSKRHTCGKPAFLIHTSGTGILFWKTINTSTYGDLEPKVYDDWDGIDELTSLPDFALHRNVEKIILEAANDGNGLVKTAIVCPPIIYGLGRGPGNKRGKLLYDLAHLTLRSGEGVRVGKGENRQTHIHVHDLSDLYVLLVEQAAMGGGNATWGKKGYYFASNGDQVRTADIICYSSPSVLCTLHTSSFGLTIFLLFRHGVKLGR